MSENTVLSVVQEAASAAVHYVCEPFSHKKEHGMSVIKKLYYLVRCSDDSRQGPPNLRQAKKYDEIAHLAIAKRRTLAI